MKEELYVIKDNERFRVDLNSPSGITLNFKSNIFGDLSKITCSYSYTFKLPLTLNNRLVFDRAEDIRHESNMVRKKLKAEFYQNGIMIFDDANLYINTIEGGVQAVLTWGIVRGLEALKDDDISLNELPFMNIAEVARYGIKTSVPRPTDWDNTSDYFIPFRRSEGAYYDNQERYIHGSGNGSSALPVVPVQRIIQAINDYYGTDFYFGDNVSGTNAWDANTLSFANVGETPPLVAFGAVPLINKGLTDEEYELRTGTFTNVEVLNNSFWGIALKVWDDCTAYNVLSFDYIQPTKNNYYDIGNNGSTTGTTKKYTFFKKGLSIVEKVELDGYIRVTMSNIGRRWNASGTKLLVDHSDIIPKLIIYRRSWKFKEGSSTNGEIVYEEAATLEGKSLGTEILQTSDYRYEFGVFEFDFREAEGRNRLALDDFNSSSETYPYFMSINEVVRTVNEVSDFKIVPTGYMSDNINKGWEVDIVSNLPDISCLTFMKSLYYMIGAFPNTNRDGRIVPCYYKDLYSNIAKYNVSDWSKKLVGVDSDAPVRIAFTVSGFARKNYYLMKNDELEEDDSSEREDVYESGMGCIKCDNETLEKEQTIIQIPYYGAFIQDADRPSYETGHDMKYKKFNDDDTTDFCEAKPAIGIVQPIEECTYLSTGTPPVCQGLGTYALLFHIWDGFKTIDEDPSYDALQCIIQKPVVITEYINLDELDLRDIDYTMPIYLNKYNCYFAVVSIQRETSGKCKCELLKIPN